MRIVLPILLSLFFTLSACGQKGDLFIPQPDQTNDQAA